MSRRSPPYRTTRRNKPLTGRWRRAARRAQGLLASMVVRRRRGAAVLDARLLAPLLLQHYFVNVHLPRVGGSAGIAACRAQTNAFLSEFSAAQVERGQCPDVPVNGCLLPQQVLIYALCANEADRAHSGVQTTGVGGSSEVEMPQDAWGASRRNRRTSLPQPLLPTLFKPFATLATTRAMWVTLIYRPRGLIFANGRECTESAPETTSVSYDTETFQCQHCAANLRCARPGKGERPRLSSTLTAGTRHRTVEWPSGDPLLLKRLSDTFSAGTSMFLRHLRQQRNRSHSSR